MLRDLFLDIGALGLPPEIQIIPWLLAVIWTIFVLEQVGLITMPATDIRGDITTIITSQLTHLNFRHILSNSAGIVLLLWIYMTNTPDPWIGLAVMFIGAELLLWLFGPSNLKAKGISAFLYALSGWFLIWSFDRNFPFKNSIILVVLFLVLVRSIFRGVLPSAANRGIAWSGHLSGLAVGVAWGLYYFGYLDRWLESYR